MTKPLPIADLVKLASQAVPPSRPARCSWAKFEKVIEALQGYSLIEAVDWLIAQGQIPASKRQAAYKALSQLFSRRTSRANA